MLHKFLLPLCVMAGLCQQAAAENAITPYPAPELAGISHWINSQPLTIKSLKGKVVLVDFWTYSCINCIRTLSYITNWDKQYREKGLVIIGVHAPEFDFEKDPANVERAVKKWGITYPVAMDNDMGTWQAFSNRYWPAHYLIDKEGKVVATHFGEGGYAETEAQIQALLGLKENVANDRDAPQAFSADQTPETYLGYSRADRMENAGEVKRDEVTDYHMPATLPLHHFALGGSWNVSGERVMALSDNSHLHLHFNARKVFLVLGSAPGKTTQAKLLLGSKPLGSNAGQDVKDSAVNVDSHRLYALVDQGQKKENTLDIQASNGLEAYAFTFGE